MRSRDVVDHRVLAAAPGGLADARRALPPRRARAPRVLDGALFYLAAAVAHRARAARASGRDAALVQGVHEVVAFLVARAARAASRTKVDPRRAGRLARGDAAVRLAAPPAAQPGERRARAVRGAPRRRGAHGLDADDRARARARRRAGRGLPVVRRRGGVPRAAARAAAGAAARRLRRRARAVQGVRHARRGLAARRAARAGRDAAHRRRRHDARPRAARSSQSSPAQTEWSPRLDRGGGRGGDGRRAGSSACRRAPKGCRASRSRRPAAAARSSAANRAGIPDVVAARRRTACSSTRTTPAALADALVRILSDRALAERLGAARAAHRRGVGRDAGASTRRRCARSCDGVLAG